MLSYLQDMVLGGVMKATFTTSRNDKKVVYDMKIEKDGDVYEINCLDKSGQSMGFVTFEFFNKYLWIYKIETKEEFQHQGVGSALLKMIEYFAMQNGKNQIEAKYYPSNQYAKPLYEKHGYFIPNQKGTWEDYDETWTMSKWLDFKQIKKFARDIKIEKEKDDEEITIE